MEYLEIEIPSTASGVFNQEKMREECLSGFIHL
jgi:hypothetical protein